MDRPLPLHLQQVARGSFRALHVIVDFFAPWQKQEEQQEAKQAQSHTPAHPREVAHALRQHGPTHCAQLLVATEQSSSRRARQRAARPRNTALPAANQGLRPAVLPLRVIRAVEQHMPPSASGRMVISGRMADVCAELERLSDAAQA
jgi:hypothetical protein